MTTFSVFWWSDERESAIHHFRTMDDAGREAARIRAMDGVPVLVVPDTMSMQDARLSTAMAMRAATGSRDRTFAFLSAARRDPSRRWAA